MKVLDSMCLYNRGLSDVDKDGKLNCDEFCIAMHLIDLVKMGRTLPPTLPPELLPTKARSGSFGVPPVNQPQPAQSKMCGFLVNRKIRAFGRAALIIQSDIPSS